MDDIILEVVDDNDDSNEFLHSYFKMLNKCKEKIPTDGMMPFIIEKTEQYTRKKIDNIVVNEINDNHKRIREGVKYCYENEIST